MFIAGNILNFGVEVKVRYRKYVGKGMSVL